MKGYKPVDEIMANYKNYTREQAKADNCVIYNNYYDKFKEFDKFLEETKKGENRCIRLISYASGGVIGVKDIEYKDGEYLIEYTHFSEITPEINNKEIEKEYYIGDTIEVNSREIGNSEYSEITYSLINTKREAVLLERFKKMIKEGYEKELEQFCDKSKRLESYKFMEEEKGNVFDESKIDEYDKLYLEEYKKGVEKCLEEEFKILYEDILESRLGQKEEIFFRYELTEEYKSN